MFDEAASDQQEFLEQAKSARKGREERKCHQAASVAIQAGARGFLARTRLKNKIRKVSWCNVYDGDSFYVCIWNGGLWDKTKSF